jgi:PleD family two-component response regulator
MPCALRIRGGFLPAGLGHSRLELPCTFIAGLTGALPDGSRSSILRQADRALYAAQREGRNRTKIGSERIR